LFIAILSLLFGISSKAKRQATMTTVGELVFRGGKHSSSEPTGNNDKAHRPPPEEPPEEDVENGCDSPPTATAGQPQKHFTLAEYPPRMVLRNLPFEQSQNRFNVRYTNRGFPVLCLLRRDWFHVFLNMGTFLSLAVLLILWTALLCLFAVVYMRMDRRHEESQCGLTFDGKPITYAGAFAFSLETCTTVGYTLPYGTNAFFSHCPGLQSVLFAQMVWSMLFNAFLFAFMYTRLARANRRGAQVLFSKSAIVSCTEQPGQVRFQIRVYDIDAKHPVVEAHVRIYALARDRPVPRPLRLLQPNDEYGGMLFLSMPSIVSHHVDCYSLLHPPPPGGHHVDSGGLVLRQIDSAACNREEVVCPICSEAYGTHERYVKHVRFQQLWEQESDVPVDGSHLSISDKMLDPPTDLISDISTLRDYFEAEIAEVLCVVEGIDPLVSGSFQALQSYRFEDIVWDGSAVFQPCMDVDGERIQVDLNRFHNVETRRADVELPASEDSEGRMSTHERSRVAKSRSARVHDALFWQ
jgi:hypothetical protein